MKKGIKQMVAEASSDVQTWTVSEAMAALGRPDVAFVDLREPDERSRDGMIPGAEPAPRGMLEFYADPESPYHKPVFAQDRKYVFFCAGGMRSALAAHTAQRMGLKPVAHIRGGFGAWKKAGGPVEEPPAKT